tara:strand:- start:710 stop:1690 length:981 start_codon:yes stop_codon:yes gene_type:complete
MRWGIVGHGGIAPTFIEAARGVGHDLVAVAGRDASRASDFARDHAIGWSTDDLRDLAGRVEAAYVCTPHDGHRDASITLLEANVPVLCEKPLGVNAHQVEQMVEASRVSGTLLMEAMWTRHLPVMAACGDWIRQGRLGNVQMVEADFGFVAPYTPSGRLWSTNSAGGSLLDVGIYPLTMADLAYKSLPLSFEADAVMSPTGVDARISVTAKYPNGGSAILRSAIDLDLGQGARIVGTEGRIEIPDFWQAERATLFSAVGEKVDEVEHPHRINGFEYQITEMARCLDYGTIESPVIPHARSAALADLMDQIRSHVGVVYPADTEAVL